MYFIHIQTTEGWRSTDICYSELDNAILDARSMSYHSTRVVEVYEGEEIILQETHPILHFLNFDEDLEVVNWMEEGF